MTGKVLGYDNIKKNGVISSDDGSRYNFTNDDWKDTSAQPIKEMKVDFESQEGHAVNIYVLRDSVVENTNTMMGLLAIGITLFFGFIGTFVSRVVIAKESVGSAVMPTLIHFFITICVIIPIAGWFIYLIGSFYYMYKNYILVIKN